jgi:hypothetical protein
VLLCDDLLATEDRGSRGTVDPVAGGVVEGAAFAVELNFLNGRKKLPGLDVFAHAVRQVRHAIEPKTGGRQPIPGITKLMYTYICLLLLKLSLL